MLLLYRLLFLPSLTLAAPRFLRRMVRRGGYGRNFSHRFGSFPELPARTAGTRRLWIQAVSVGEVLAIGPLLQRLREDGFELVLTTTTSTGYAVAAERYGPWLLGLGYFPIDFILFVARAWNRIRPDAALLVESELWPEHLRQASRRRVPVLLINARMSDRSFRRLSRFRRLVRPLARGLTAVLASSGRDCERWASLGLVEPGRVSSAGNLKFDLEIPPLDDQAKTRLRSELGLPPDGLILLGSSTWRGEEEVLLRLWRRARALGRPVSLLLVPRHAERRGEIEALLRAESVSAHFRSRGPARSQVEVAVGDTTGELRSFTALADLVFVGKSLPPNQGGQTPIEAAALGRPLLFGPEMGNFREAADSLVAARAAVRVDSAGMLEEAVLRLLADPQGRRAMGEAAAYWQRQNRGALARTLQAIQSHLGA